MDMTVSTPAVTVSEGRVRVTNWETPDPEIVRYFETHGSNGGDGKSLAALLERALKVGVLALESVGVSVDVHYVEKEFDRLASKMGSSVDQHAQEIKTLMEKVFAEEAGALPRVLRKYLGEGGHLEELFDPNRRDSAVGRIQELLEEHFEGEGSTLYRMLDLNNSSSPLHKWREEHREDSDNIRRLIENYRSEIKEQAAAGKARAEVLEKSALKGREYEDLVFEAVNEIARVFGDTTEATGDQPGLGGSKVGDTVVSLNHRDTRGVPLRLVFEAKDKFVGLTPILREIDEARDNRDAAAGIAVYSRGEYMPTGTAPFRELGNARYVCLCDKDTPKDIMSLQLAYRAARFWALADHRPEGVVDIRGISEDVESATTRLKTFASLKGQLTKVKSSMDEGFEKLQDELEELAKDLTKIFGRIDERIRIQGGNADSSEKGV